MTTPTTAGSKAAADLAALLRARNPLIWIVTREEARAERGIMEAAAAALYVARFWDCATGITNELGEEAPRGRGAGLTDPAAVLSEIRAQSERAVYVLRDFHKWLADPTVLRATRSLARWLPTLERNAARAAIILAPAGEVPPELSGHAIVLEWPLPDRTEVGAILDTAIAMLPDDLRGTAAPNGTRDAAIDAAVGLTEAEAASCYARSLVTTRKIDPATVAGEKKRVIARERVLEWYDPIPGGLEAVGGLESVKAWLMARRSAFSARARAYGLPPPKGCLLVGVSGCGKSLTAKAVATAWGVPLLRLDLGALRSKWVGESEGNIRKALRVAEAVAPCVVWLDEIEKALSGATSGAADGGVSGDALGVILSWMQDRAGSVFVVATANDVRALPPELLRKGRFDELFFVDLPTTGERAAILRAALKAHGRAADGVDVAEVARACQDFTGAEVAALVPDALYAAFADGERPIATADLLAAAKGCAPLARTAGEKIEQLRSWAKGRARVASLPESTTTTGARGALDL